MWRAQISVVRTAARWLAVASGLLVEALKTNLAAVSVHRLSANPLFPAPHMRTLERVLLTPSSRVTLLLVHSFPRARIHSRTDLDTLATL